LLWQIRPVAATPVEYLMAGKPARLFSSVAIAGVLALSLASCKTLGLPDATGSTELASTPQDDADSRHEVDLWGQRYKANPHDIDTALHYAQALRATDQRAQAVAVLEQETIHNPDNKKLLGAYGRALADVGRYEQALDVLGKAHTPDEPDWRILSAQGAVLDQMDRHKEAQAYYASALKIVPDEPTVLSNLGLSYALAKDLAKAEATLRRATAQPNVDPRVRQNLALVVGLQGRFREAEDIARADLPSDEAAANAAYLRAMLTPGADWKHIARPQTAMNSDGT
jgi:Flp pilus assembly protein TadD